MEAETHWDEIYARLRPTEVSWYQPHAQPSLEMIARAEVCDAAQIIDVGGGASTLVDDLLTRGFRHVTVLDLSREALEAAKARLRERAGGVTWRQADITQASLPADFYDVWHDRAVFHFLPRPEDQERYVDAVRRSVKTGGQVILATFSPNGPTECSGLPVVRYDAQGLQAALGEGFALAESFTESHRTPFETEQEFVYCSFRKT